jgi:hypothetical protein
MQPRDGPNTTADPQFPVWAAVDLRILRAMRAILRRLLLAHAGQMRIAQIELQLDPAPRFVVELAAAI